MNQSTILGGSKAWLDKAKFVIIQGGNSFPLREGQDQGSRDLFYPPPFFFYVSMRMNERMKNWCTSHTINYKMLLLL